MTSSSFNKCSINLGALSRNYRRIADFASHPVMAVVKGDAYGHGLVPCAQALAAAGATDLGVLDLEEALCLRRYPLGADIHVLAGLMGPIQSLRAIEAGLVILAYDLRQIRSLSKAAESLGTEARIWLKVDTGMSRLGLQWHRAGYCLSNIATFKNLRIEGLATHLATSGDGGAEEQLARLLDVGEKAARILGFPIRYSALASGGTLAHRDFPDGLSRVGLLLYGYSPLAVNSPALAGARKSKNLIRSLEPVMSLSSRLIQVGEARAGDTIGYDRTFTATRDIKFGTAPIGYVHGLSRTRSSTGHALVDGKMAKLLGRVCMNLSMYDVSAMGAQPGQEIVLLGRQDGKAIGADLAGSWQDTNAYEALCLFGRLNPRTYVAS